MNKVEAKMKLYLPLTKKEKAKAILFGDKYGKLLQAIKAK